MGYEVCGYGDDSPHEVIEEVELLGGGVLHRFLNPGGVPYSAIYVRGEEQASWVREGEESLVKWWNDNMIKKAKRSIPRLPDGSKAYDYIQSWTAKDLLDEIHKVKAVLTKAQADVTTRQIDALEIGKAAIRAVIGQDEATEMEITLSLCTIAYELLSEAIQRVVHLHLEEEIERL